MDIPWYLASSVAALASCIATLYVAGYRQRQGQLDARLRDLEEHVWQFSQRAEDYWLLDSADDKSVGLEAAMKHLSVRIGDEIAHLNSTHRDFDFRDHECLVALRRAAMGSPFEETGRRPDPRRGDETRAAASRLVRELLKARRRAWRTN